MNKKIDKRKKYYLILDCETATLPQVVQFAENARKNIAIAKPLIYDLGWKLIDRKGKVYKTESFLITEIFSVPAIFNTAYYKDKRPLYLKKLKNNEITLTNWNTAINILLQDIEIAEAVGAYNSMFDFKKALTFTEDYISHLYSNYYYEWEKMQVASMQRIASGEKPKNKNFDKDNFIFRNKKYPLFCIWGLTCHHLINNDDYRNFCIKNKFYTPSKKYYPTNAEIVYAFLTNNEQFKESHTALEDVNIEIEILLKVWEKQKPQKMTMGIIYFPFRELGRMEVELE